MKRTTPSPESQLEFLGYLQRLLDEGEFVATYKFALLMALADLSVELGDDSDAPLRIHVEQIARKFVRYYWRQVRPYVRPAGTDAGSEIWQNTGRQAKVVQLVREASERYGPGPSPDVLETSADRKLIRDVASNVKKMPLWKLQVLGREVEDFLYPNVGRGDVIELRPGVAYCFRRFHGFVRRLAQDGWLAFVRGCRRNVTLLGEGVDLGEFLFGTERASLDVYRPLLRELQSGTCFYCARRLRESEVDHFVPWSRYGVDLGHNFVLACRACNNAKRDLLSGRPHLERWIERNLDRRDALLQFFDERAVPHDLEGSFMVTRWAYGQTARARGHVWLRAGETADIGPWWAECFETIGRSP